MTYDDEIDRLDKRIRLLDKLVIFTNILLILAVLNVLYWGFTYIVSIL